MQLGNVGKTPNVAVEMSSNFATVTTGRTSGAATDSIQTALPEVHLRIRFIATEASEAAHWSVIGVGYGRK